MTVAHESWCDKHDEIQHLVCKAQVDHIASPFLVASSLIRGHLCHVSIVNQTTEFLSTDDCQGLVNLRPS